MHSAHRCSTDRRGPALGRWKRRNGFVVFTEGARGPSHAEVSRRGHADMAGDDADQRHVMKRVRCHEGKFAAEGALQDHGPAASGSVRFMCNLKGSVGPPPGAGDSLEALAQVVDSPFRRSPTGLDDYLTLAPVVVNVDNGNEQQLIELQQMPHVLTDAAATEFRRRGAVDVVIGGLDQLVQLVE